MKYYAAVHRKRSISLCSGGVILQVYVKWEERSGERVWNILFKKKGEDMCPFILKQCKSKS